MADEVQQRFGIETELIKGQEGVFEIALDGEPIFSKNALGRFPEPSEVEDIVGSRMA